MRTVQLYAVDACHLAHFCRHDKLADKLADFFGGEFTGYFFVCKRFNRRGAYNLLAAEHLAPLAPGVMQLTKDFCAVAMHCVCEAL